MNHILEIAVSNAAAAGGLAVVVFAVTRLVRRPALACGLWLLVLARLVAPPLWTIPVGDRSGIEDVFGSLDESHDPPAERVDPVADWRPTDPGTVRPESTLPVDIASSGPAADPGPKAHEPQVAAEQPPPAFAMAAQTVTADERDEAFPWTEGLVALWLAGTLICAALTVARTVRFQRLVRRLDPGPAWLQIMADELSRRFGLRRAPVVLVAPGRIAPLLWICGRAVLVLPAELLATLPRDRQRMLVAHELAHYRRGDHLVRWFEAIVAALYWWHPAVWWARRELRRAEEACCDAWVLWAVPGAEREYAHLLLDTLDFLCGARAVRPALASGFGPAHGLRRRLPMILNNKTARRLSHPARLGLAVARVLVLAVTVVWGQAEPDERPTADPQATVPEEPAEPELLPAETPTVSAEPTISAHNPLDALRVDEPVQPLSAAAPANEPSASSAAAAEPSDNPRRAQVGGRADHGSDELLGIPIDDSRQRIASALLAALQDQDIQVRAVAASALGRLGQRSDEVITALAGMLKQAKEPGEVRAAALALGELVKPSRESIDVLIPALRHSHQSVREKARAALDETSKALPSQEAIDALVGALRHDDQTVQEAVRSVLREIGGHSDQVVKSLATAIDSDDAIVQKNAHAALSDLMALSSSVVDALIESLKDENPRIRSAAVQALGTTSSLLPSEKIIDALIEASKSNDASVRRRAVHALGSVGTGKTRQSWPVPYRSHLQSGTR